MKKLKFIVLILAIFIIFPVALRAEKDVETEQASSETQTERVEKAKKTYPVRLNEQEKANLADRCSKAQDKLSKIATRLEVRGASITTKYSRIELHLIAVQKRLAAQRIDTTIIDSLISKFQLLNSEYIVALANFQVSLGDAVSFDCASDPAAFKALLEDVRDKRKTFVNAVEAIKNFTKDDLKTSFDDLRTRINSKGQEE